MLIVEFYGVPSAGKSVFAAGCYSESVKHGFSATLVTEYVKSLANRNIPISDIDQLYIIGNQTRWETECYGNYEVVFADSSPMLGAFYCAYYSRGEYSMQQTVLDWEQRVALKHGVKRLRVFLPRNPNWFQQKGRYQQAEAAALMEPLLVNFLDGLKDPYITLDHRDPLALFEYIKKEGLLNDSAPRNPPL